MIIQKLWKPFFFLGSLTLTVTVSPMVVAESGISEAEPRNPYPREFVRNYISSCNERSQTEGLTSQQSEILCQCTIDQYQDRFSIEEFAAIVQQLQTTGQAPDELIDVALTCNAELKNN